LAQLDDDFAPLPGSFMSVSRTKSAVPPALRPFDFQADGRVALPRDQADRQVGPTFGMSKMEKLKRE
jgi:hypothetical protein